MQIKWLNRSSHPSKFQGSQLEASSHCNLIDFSITQATIETQRETSKIIYMNRGTRSRKNPNMTTETSKLKLPSLLVVAPNGENYGYPSQLDSCQRPIQISPETCQRDDCEARRVFMRNEWQQHRLSLLGKQIRPQRSSTLISGAFGHSLGHASRNRSKSCQLRWMIRVRNFLEQPQSPLAWLYHCCL